MIKRRVVEWTIVVVALIGSTLTPVRGAELRTATQHPIQYYLSLPESWAAAKKWPVVVAIESANRNFAINLEIFEKARRTLLFIIGLPFVVTIGGVNEMNVQSYKYSNEVWDRIEREGPFKFDSGGIAAIVADVKKQYGGEDKYFLTGWEAGGHTVWAMIFQHPEALRAAAPVSFNYQERWMSADTFRSDPSLPIRIFRVEVLREVMIPQIDLAKQTAAAHGFRNVSEEVVKKPHGPLAEEVLRYFASLL